MTPELSRHLGAGNTLSIEVLTEIQHNTSLDMKSTERNTFLNTLHRRGDFSQYPHFEAAVTEFLTLTEDEDDAVFVSAPSAAKPAKKARKHSLKQAKEDNRPSAKKH